MLIIHAPATCVCSNPDSLHRIHAIFRHASLLGPQASLKAIEAVSPGSDLHVMLAVRHYDCTAKQHGEDSSLAGMARQALRRAHVARYGHVSEQLIEKLISLNRKLHVEA